eukprot:52666-Eustigmatos_ZCMA.PRE.1
MNTHGQPQTNGGAPRREEACPGDPIGVRTKEQKFLLALVCLNVCKPTSSRPGNDRDQSAETFGSPPSFGFVHQSAPTTW